MFQLLQPIWLFAIPGIAIPLIIHLWNNRKGKTLPVGSILLLQQSASQKAPSRRLTDILLLVLRSLLIIVLALLMAKPTWIKNLSAVSEKGWLLIEKQSVQEAYNNFRSTVDSLNKAGYKFHYFNKGLQAEKFEDALKAGMDSTLEDEEISYWVLLKQLNEEVPAELPVYLFTNNLLKRFKGTRPQLSMNLTWETYVSNDSIAGQLVKAFKTNADSIRIIEANSGPEASFFTTENIPTNGNGSYNLSNSSNKTFLTGLNNKTNSIEMDTASLNIAIYSDLFTNDAGYLRAAIDAIREYTECRINVSTVNSAEELTGRENWLFWLSEKPLPSKALPRWIFVYEKGKEERVTSWIRTIHYPISQEAITMSRRIAAPAVNSFEVKWKDGFGNILLGLEKPGNNIYHFYSRLNPEWNDLAWSTQFVKMIFDLIIKHGNIKNVDKRKIDGSQLQPGLSKKTKAFDKEKFMETTDLAKLFWIMAFLFFCLERMLSFKENKKDIYV